MLKKNQKLENVKIQKELSFFSLKTEIFEEKKLPKKKLFSKFSQSRRIVFDQSSPVQPVSEFRGGPLSLTNKRTNERTNEGNPRV